MRGLALVCLLSTGGACQAVKPEAGGESTLEDDGELRAKAAGAGMIGTPGPAMTLTTIDGAQIDLGGLLGKRPIYLKFWATWCVPCKEQMPGLAQIYAQMGEKLEVVAVNTGFNDDEAAVRAFREEIGLKVPIVIDDGRLADALNLRVTPQHVVIGRDGRILHVGHLADARLEAALRDAVAEGEGSPVAGEVEAPARVFKLGEPVRDLVVTTTGGARVAIGAEGRVRGLVLFAPWCESYLAESRPAVAQACLRVREEVEALVGKGDVEWLGISSGLWATEKDLADYVATTGTKLPLALDASGAVFRAFGVREIPTVVVIDAQGRVARVLGPEVRGIGEAVKGLGGPAVGGGV